MSARGGWWAVLLSAAIGIGPFAGSVARGQAARAITFDQLVEYLELSVPEDKIRQRIAASPTRFVLGEDQQERLRAAGASDSLLAFLSAPNASVEAPGDISDFVVILDCSGSMNDRLTDGGSKWDAARGAALRLISSVPAGRRLSLIVYGVDLSRKCHSIDVVRPLTELGAKDRQELALFIEQLQALGHTPMAGALEAAGTQLETASGMSTIVLITDGMETCHGDPVAVAAGLAKRFPNLRGGIQVVGFCLGDNESREVGRIAAAGNGQYYDARTAQQLLDSIRKIEARVVPPAPRQTVSLEGVSLLDRSLIEQLGDGDIDARAEAAEALGQRQVRAAAPALRNLLLEAPYGTGLAGDVDREAALKALLAIEPEQVGEALSAVLTSNSRPVRIWAATAIARYQVSAACGAVVNRLLALTDADLPSSAINGTDEADALFAALAAADPDRLEPTLVRLMRSTSPLVRGWASGKASRLP